MQKEKNCQNLNSKVVLHMRGNGLAIGGMEKVFKYGQMVQNMMENGSIIKHVVKEHFIMLMEILMLENGRMIKLMDLVYIDNKMELFIKVIGKVIINMVKEKKDVLNIKMQLGVDNSTYKGEYF